jgi:segregation and condensation protein A
VALQLELPPLPGDEDPRWTIHTEVFDGPLDLLLYLVRRDGIDLLKLPVARIADSYLAYLERLRSLNLSIAADYLVMAATLVHLKSLELLPRPPTPVEEDDVDPREELVRRLREHARIAAAADLLAERPLLGEQVHTREPLEVDDGVRPLTTQADAFALLDTYYRLLQRKEAPPARVQLVSSGPDLGACVQRLLDALGGVGGRGELGDMLRSLPSRAERVVTFLASLEMARLGWLTLVQTTHLGPVEVTRNVADDDIDLTMVVGFDPPDGDGDEEGQMGLPLSSS